MTYLQQPRLLSIEPPSGKNHVLLTRFEGHEALSALFCYRLTLSSRVNQQETSAWLGQSVTFSVNSAQKDTRYFHGLIQSLALGYKNRSGFTDLQVTVVPSLWLLTQSSNCRIFQNLTVIEIVKILLRDHHILALDCSRLQKHYPTCNYCVQYNESAYDFIRRILSEAGITFYFSHTKTQHKIVLCDTLTSYPLEQHSSHLYLHTGLQLSQSNRLIFSMQHYAKDNSFTTQSSKSIIQTYTNNFNCLPESTPYSPPIIAKPIITGPQTATVIKRQDQVKVQFLWDHLDENVDSVSCWISIDQRFAVCVGQEVLVDFIQGDPDRPIILGALYNRSNQPCFNTTDEKFKSGFKSERFDEISFDHSDDPCIRLQTHEDYSQTVVGDSQISVGKDLIIKIDGDYEVQVQSGRYVLTSTNKIIFQSSGGYLSLSPEEIFIRGFCACLSR